MRTCARGTDLDVRTAADLGWESDDTSRPPGVHLHHGATRVRHSPGTVLLAVKLIDETYPLIGNRGVWPQAASATLVRAACMSESSATSRSVTWTVQSPARKRGSAAGASWIQSARLSAASPSSPTPMPADRGRSVADHTDIWSSAPDPGDSTE